MSGDFERRPLSTAQRLAARERPGGSPVMYQSCGDLLFMRWRVPAGEPLVHHGGPVDVEVWALEEV